MLKMEMSMMETGKEDSSVVRDSTHKREIAGMQGSSEMESITEKGSCTTKMETSTRASTKIARNTDRASMIGVTEITTMENGRTTVLMARALP